MHRYSSTSFHVNSANVGVFANNQTPLKRRANCHLFSLPGHSQEQCSSKFAIQGLLREAELDPIGSVRQETTLGSPSLHRRGLFTLMASAAALVRQNPANAYLVEEDITDRVFQMAGKNLLRGPKF